MTDTDERLRNEAALKIFEREIKSQLQEPLATEEVYVEKPRLVTPYRASAKDRSFWRIPVISGKYSRVIGFFDVRNLDEQSNAHRVSRLPSRNIAAEEEIQDLPTDTLELSDAEIHAQAKETFGDDIKLINSPELVFDQMETRVAWKVDLEKEGEVFSALVTPGYAYRA